MKFNPNRNSSNGRFTHGTKSVANINLTVVDGIHSQEPSTRAVALMDPQCPYEDLEFAATNDANKSVRLTAVAYAPEAGLEDRNPFVRALAQDLSGEAHDGETTRVLRLLAA